nr:hypothetical protein [Tanacetum cinerariifolium]
MHVLEQNVEEEVKSYGLTSMGDITFDQLMDEYEKKQRADLEESKSPYDTESEIKFVKSFYVSTGSVFINQDMMGNIADSPLQDHLIKEKVDSDLHSMLDDEVNSVSSFKASGSTDEEDDKTETRAKLSQSDKATADNILDEMTDLKTSAAKSSYLMVLLG